MGSENYVRVVSPWDGHTVVGEVPDQGIEAVDDAVAAASTALTEWTSMPAPERLAILDKGVRTLLERSADIGDVLSLEAGKNIAEATGEVLRAADVINYAIGLGRMPDGYTAASGRPGVVLSSRRFPLGVVGIITPFNFPAFVPALKLGPALAAGNAVIWKPSPFTPLTALRIQAAFEDAGLPRGVMKVVCGNDPLLGARLVEHPQVRAISFTGSTAVGRRVIAAGAASATPVQAEMGGFNPVVVLDDAPVGLAAESIAEAAFGGSGQKCTATRRVLVTPGAYEAFMAELLQRAETLRAGSRDEGGLGPVISRAARDRVHEQVQTRTAKGAAVAAGGFLPDVSDNGWFYPATVLVGEADTNADEEIFGPVVEVVMVESLEAALESISASSYGLAAGIMANSLVAVETFRESVRAGLLAVNLPTTGVEPQVPFGGLGDSGWGPREVGINALQFYSEERTVALRGTV